MRWRGHRGNYYAAIRCCKDTGKSRDGGLPCLIFLALFLPAFAVARNNCRDAPPNA